MSEGRLLVLDATVISNFASSCSLEWLSRQIADPVVPVAVYRELQRGREAGYEFLRDALAFCEYPTVRIERTAVARGGANERPHADILDDGEAATLTYAEEANGVLATDDGIARRTARSRSVPVTGSVGLLADGVNDDSITVERADQWLQTWVEERGYYAPVETVSQALSSE